MTVYDSLVSESPTSYAQKLLLYAGQLKLFERWGGYVSQYKNLDAEEIRQLRPKIYLGEHPQGATRDVDFNAGIVKIGEREGASSEAWRRSLLELSPWKKGPFSLFGVTIDAEWRSDLKWDRLRFENLKGRRVADIGCNNGYFSLRMLAHDPELVLGFEPFETYVRQFDHVARPVMDHYPIFLEPLGIESLTCYPKFFDTIFCMGVIYHRRDPLSSLTLLFQALRPGGELVLESQGIEGEQSVALTPRGRYCRARGIWFLPTSSCLVNWLHRVGFREIEVFYAEPLSTLEQRRTAWADISSLVDSLTDNGLTVEGYPPPWRIYVRARR